MGYRAFFDEYRSFGVEIEVYGQPKWTVQSTMRGHGFDVVQLSQTNEVIDRWRISDDSSIEGPYPMEIISPVLMGTEGLAQVDRLMDALYVRGCEVNISCGFHVHWNVADFTGKQMLSLLRLYTKFEPVIDYLVSFSRRSSSNETCKSLVKDTDLSWISALDHSEKRKAKEVAWNFHSQHSQNQYSQGEKSPSRHHKVNLTAYLLYKTVEFRQHQGTVNGEKAVNWIMFTQQVVNKAKYGSVSRNPSAKPTLGEMLRVLRLVDHAFVEDECTDLKMYGLAVWLKRRYQEFKREEGTLDLRR